MLSVQPHCYEYKVISLLWVYISVLSFTVISYSSHSSPLRVVILSSLDRQTVVAAYDSFDRNLSHYESQPSNSSPKWYSRYYER